MKWFVLVVLLCGCEDFGHVSKSLFRSELSIVKQQLQELTTTINAMRQHMAIQAVQKGCP